jgi:hypothetical protein
MMKRLQTAVLDRHPDMVIWQVGTNAVLRNLDPRRNRQTGRGRHREDSGCRRRSGAGRSAIFSGGQRARRKAPGKMINLLGKVAELRHVGIFPRFEVMRDWQESRRSRSTISSSPTACT